MPFEARRWKREMNRGVCKPNTTSVSRAFLVQSLLVVESVFTYVFFEEK